MLPPTVLPAIAVWLARVIIRKDIVFSVFFIFMGRFRLVMGCFSSLNAARGKKFGPGNNIFQNPSKASVEEAIALPRWLKKTRS